MNTNTSAELEEIPLAVAVDTVLGSLVDSLVETERIGAKMAAWRVEQVDRIRRFVDLNTPVTTSRGMRPWSQAATARRTAETLLAESQMLTERLPLTMAGLTAGDSSFRHAKSIVSHAQSLPAELHGEFERRVVPHASTLTVSKFDQKARAARDRMDSATIKERHETSLADREISFDSDRDGMAWLNLRLAAADAVAIYHRVTDMARELDLPAEERTLAQLRVDVATDLLLDGEVTGRAEFGIRPWVAVTVPVLSLLNHGGIDTEFRPICGRGSGFTTAPAANRAAIGLPRTATSNGPSPADAHTSANPPTDSLGYVTGLLLPIRRRHIHSHRALLPCRYDGPHPRTAAFPRGRRRSARSDRSAHARDAFPRGSRRVGRRHHGHDDGTSGQPCEG